MKINPAWEAELREHFARRDRFEQFMGDWRAADAINCEFATCGPCPSPMDVEDFVRMLKGRADKHWMPRRVLHRWGVV